MIFLKSTIWIGLLFSVTLSLLTLRVLVGALCPQK